MKTYNSKYWKYIGCSPDGWHTFQSRPINGREPELSLVKRARYIQEDGSSTYYNHIANERIQSVIPVRKVKYAELNPALKSAIMKVV